MSKYFQIVDAEPLESKNQKRDFYASGDGWVVIQNEKNFRLEYISGELQGDEKSIEITAEEASKMKSGELDLDGVLIAYNVN